MVSKKRITLVFSDIENSTQLAQKLREEYPALLEMHRATIRRAIEKNEGTEIDTAGDGFFMVFNEPESAILASCQIQREFQTKEWATKVGLKTRMGIHTGLALETVSGYTGVEVHFASRICGAAYGGQVLVSAETKQYLTSEDNKNYSLSALGNYAFKDFTYPIELYQLNFSGLQQKFPKPRIKTYNKKIAILPFTNLSKKSEYDYIGYGMAEEIIIALGKINGLRVVSRSTSFAVKKRDLTVKEIGEKLEVNSILEGKIYIHDDHLIITVELIDTDSGLNIWSEKYDSTKEQLLSVQDDIIQKISKTMKFDMHPEQMGSVQQRQTYNAEAYDYYLRGRRFYLKFSKQGINLAIKMFENAIVEDNSYALAYAGMADCHSYQYQHLMRTPEILEKADLASQQAIKLGPELAEVYVSRANVLNLCLQIEEAEKYFRIAIERDPTLFLGWYHYGRMCFAAGKLEKAARLFVQANRVAPEDYQSLFLAAQAYEDIEAFDLAKKLRRRGVEIAEKWIDLNPGDTRALYLTANALVFLNSREKSLSFLQLALSIEPNDSMLLYNAACIYALLGMKTEALSCAERSFKEGLRLREWYENDSNLNNIRNEPRFVKLMEKMPEGSKNTEFFERKW
jgi:TolB-like protein/Tfp pilus assembly protein PilF